jgi:hypothetical protein
VLGGDVVEEMGVGEGSEGSQPAPFPKKCLIIHIMESLTICTSFKKLGSIQIVAINKLSFYDQLFNT